MIRTKMQKNIVIKETKMKRWGKCDTSIHKGGDERFPSRHHFLE